MRVVSFSSSLVSDSDQYERAVDEQERRARGIIQGMSAGLCKKLIRYINLSPECIHVAVLFSLSSRNDSLHDVHVHVEYWHGSCTGWLVASSIESIFRTGIFTC